MPDFATVHARFAATAARTPGADFLYTESVTAQTYGIAAGAIAWSSAAAAIEGLRQALRQSRATPAAIAREAEAAGVWATMEPYVMALTSDA